MLQQYVNQEIPDVQAGFRKGRGTREQIANICWIIEKAREFQKHIFCFIDYTKAFEAQHSENKDHGIWSHTSWEIDGETVGTVSDFILGGSKITADGDCSHEIKRRLLLGRKVKTNLEAY